MKITLERFKESGTKFIELIVDKNRSGEVGSNYYWFKGADLVPLSLNLSRVIFISSRLPFSLNTVFLCADLGYYPVV